MFRYRVSFFLLSRLGHGGSFWAWKQDFSLPFRIPILSLLQWVLVCGLARLQSELQMLRRDNGALKSALCAQGREWTILDGDFLGG